MSRGLGFTRIAESGNEVIRWERVRRCLSELGVPTCGDDGYIPENIFSRLAMKAKNKTAEKFQALVAEKEAAPIGNRLSKNNKTSEKNATHP